MHFLTKWSNLNHPSANIFFLKLQNAFWWNLVSGVSRRTGRQAWYLRIQVQQNSTYPDIGYPDRLGPSGKSVENSTKENWLEITGYQINYSKVQCCRLQYSRVEYSRV